MLIPFDALPARKDSGMERVTWIVDKERMLDAVREKSKVTSVQAICHAAGLSGSRSSATWSEGAVMAIANHYGIAPETFATPRPCKVSGRPRIHDRKPCPRRIVIPEELHPVVNAAAEATGMEPSDWIHTVLKACATFTVRQEARQ